MKIWEELGVNDTIYFVILDEENVTELLTNKLKVEKTLIKSIKNIDNYYLLKTDSEVVEEIAISIKEFFTESGATVNLDEIDKALVIASDLESFSYHLKKYLEIDKNV